MKKTLKKGFTIVELVIVIAVVAILAAVLIPTFVSVVNKANVSNDTALVRNLNSALISEEATGNKPATMTDVINIAEEYGYNVENLQTKASGYKLLWNQETNRFYVQKDGKDITTNPEVTNIPADGYTYWEISNEISTTHSTYLGNYSGAAEITDLKTGLDVGNNTVTSVSYVGKGSEQNVVIRTNSFDTVLKINAATDTVKHYDKAQRVDITAIAGNSYHEYGEVLGDIVVNDGNVVAESAGKANAVILNGENAKTTIENGAEVSTVAATNTSYYVNVTNNNEATKVNGKKVTYTDKVAGGFGTEADDPYLIATCEQALYMKNLKGYFKLVADIVVNDEIYLSSKTVTLDLNGHSLKLEYGENVTPNNGGVLYIGGQKGELTINDSSEGKTGKVIGSDKSYTNKVTSAVRVGNYGKLTINGGKFYGMSEGTSCIHVRTSIASGTKATVIINGGYFETASPFNGTYYVLNHQDSATAGCTITVNGGRFKNYNPSVTVVDPVNAKTGVISLGTGCKTEQETSGNDTFYTVVKA